MCILAVLSSGPQSCVIAALRHLISVDCYKEVQAGTPKIILEASQELNLDHEHYHLMTFAQDG